MAYVDLPPRHAGQIDTPEQATQRAAFGQAVTGWNSAMYGVLVGADARIAQNVREIDQEVDRLLGEALARRWDRIEFRAERARLGELMAQHVALVRSEAGLPAMELPTVWTWNT